MRGIDLVLRNILPEKYHDDIGVLDKKNINDVLARIAQDDPDLYPDILKKVSDLGRELTYSQGETLLLSDMLPPFDRKPFFDQMDAEIAELEADEETTPDEQARLRTKIYSNYANTLRDRTMKAAREQGNNLIYGVLSGARGKTDQLVSLITTPSLYTDYKGDVIPLFVRHSFSEGLRPAEYLASTYGARASTISMKVATAEGGDLCLYQDTLVRMADGSAKRIADIRPDDKVSGADRQGRTFPSRVLRTYDQGNRPVYRYRIFAAGNTNKYHDELVTQDHKFLAFRAGRRNNPVVFPIGELAEGRDSLIKPEIFDDTGFKFTAIGYEGMLPCYDIEVEHPDHLFVLASGVICSNSKQLSNIGSHLVVREDDCGTTNGIDLGLDDESLDGRVLAKDIGDVTAGTILDRDALSRIEETTGPDTKAIVRSPLTCTTPDGICSRCAGTDTQGRLRGIGESVGVISAQSLGEPVAQAALSAKHSAGVFEGDKAQFSGIDVINQIVQSPKIFPNKAQVAELDGRVDKVEEAAQGGTDVFIDEKRHYVPPGYELLVQEGDVLEAGEQISDGLVDVKDILALRGLGEGRRFYANQLKEIMDNSGVPTDRRHTEMIARAAINHVRIDDPDGFGDHLPDDVISYNALQKRYTPDDDARVVPLDDLEGDERLQAPALHYTIGERLTPSKIERLRTSGWEDVPVGRQEPHFTPEMSRLRVAASDNYPDWLARLSGSYLNRYLTDSAVRGHEGEYLNAPHYAGPLAYGAEFGEDVRETGEF